MDRKALSVARSRAGCPCHKFGPWRRDSVIPCLPSSSGKEPTDRKTLSVAIDSCINNVLFQAQKEWAVTEEGTEQRFVPLYSAGRSTGHGGQLLGFEGGPIGQGVHLQIAPGVLHRIEFGSVGGQEESVQVMKAGNELRCTFSAVGIETVPNQQAGLPQFLVQIAEESNDLVAADVGLGMQAKVKSHAVATGRHGQGGDGRYLLQMSPPLDQHRCPATGLPTAANQ